MKEIVLGGQERVSVSGDVERAVGGLEARVAALERSLAEAVKARHTCTGDNCHVVDDRIEGLKAEIEALKLAPAPEPAEKPAAPAPPPETVECPECGELLVLPPNLREDSMVRCRECRSEFLL